VQYHQLIFFKPKILQSLQNDVLNNENRRRLTKCKVIYDTARRGAIILQLDPEQLLNHYRFECDLLQNIRPILYTISPPRNYYRRDVVLLGLFWLGIVFRAQLGEQFSCCDSFMSNR
jgi:hypothetical protein